eukprot:GHVP01052266.1.p1 GENE.GHVP01052266.1~~GHVP01052266.1.p1  ORF type:complete len:505 (+),score=75.74 GHVP01052266.1:4990-6504(+)
MIKLGICQDDLADWMDDTCVVYTDCSANSLYTSLITGLGTLFGLIGVYCGSWITAKGRRFALLTSFCSGIIGCVLNTAAVNIGMVIAGRIFIGFCMGLIGFGAVQYVIEIAPPHKRGKLVVITDYFLIIGSLTAMLLGLGFKGAPYTPDDPLDPCEEDGCTGTKGDEFCTTEQVKFDSWWWRIVMSGALLIVPVVGVILLLVCFKFNTPYWYLLNGQEDKAKKTLIMLRNSDDVEDEFDSTKWYMQSSLKEKESAQGFIEFNKEPRARRAIWTGILLGIFNTMSGSIPMSFLSVVLFMEMGSPESTLAAFSVGLVMAQFVAAVISSQLTDRIGRKPILIATTSVCFVAVFIPAILLTINPDDNTSYNVAIAGSFVFIFFYTIGLACLTFLYIFEMFPSHMKYHGQKIACTAAWIGNVIEFFIVPLMSTKAIFIKSAAFTFASIFFSIFLIKETKGLAFGHSPFFEEAEYDSQIDKVSGNSSNQSDEESLGSSVTSASESLSEKF